MSGAIKFEVGVVILNYYSAEDTIALYHQIRSFKKLRFSISVVDNSCDQSESFQLNNAIDKDDLIINSINSGYAVGNNLGIQHLSKDAEIEYFVILNPDISFDPSILTVLIKKFEQDEMLAAAGPRLCFRDNIQKIYSDGGCLIDTKGMFLPKHKNSNRMINDLNLGQSEKLDYISGSFLMLSRKAINKLGPIPVDYFLYFEETDWCYNAKLNGWKLLVDTSVVAYQRTSNKGEKYVFYMTRNCILFNKRYYKELRFWNLLKYFSIEFVSHLKHLRFSKAWSVLLGFLQGAIY
jgi:GT2 family glycosyltransferase